MEGKGHKKKDKGKKREREAVAEPADLAEPVADLGSLLLGGSSKSFDDAGLASLFEPSKVSAAPRAGVALTSDLSQRPRQCRLRLQAPSGAIGARRPTPKRI